MKFFKIANKIMQTLMALCVLMASIQSNLMLVFNNMMTDNSWTYSLLWLQIAVKAINSLIQ